MGYMDTALTNIEAVMTEIDTFNATLSASQLFVSDYLTEITLEGKSIEELAIEAINISLKDSMFLDMEGRWVLVRSRRSSNVGIGQHLDGLGVVG